MKNTGIIMSGNHPRLILDGTKTQTRRVIKFKPVQNIVASDWHAPFKYGNSWVFTARFGLATRQQIAQCPYGQVGARLWVRETFTKRVDGVEQILFKTQYDELVAMFGKDDDRPDWLPKPSPFPKLKWRPSIHMFKKDARIWLEITEVRVERVHEIKPSDCMREGWNTDNELFPTINAPDKAREWFKKLWDSLNAKRGYGWEVNPWVWVISFRRL